MRFQWVCCMPSSAIRWFSVKRVRLLTWFSVRCSQSRKSLLVKGFDGRKRCPHHRVGDGLTHVFYHLKLMSSFHSDVILVVSTLALTISEWLKDLQGRTVTPSACGPDVVIYRSSPDLLLASSAPCPLSAPWAVERGLLPNLLKCENLSRCINLLEPQPMNTDSLPQRSKVIILATPSGWSQSHILLGAVQEVRKCISPRDGYNLQFGSKCLLKHFPFPCLGGR